MSDIYTGDSREVRTVLADNSIDTIITDPPYGLEFMGKGWDKGVPGVEFWKEFLAVTKPGGMLLAFGGTRTFHRMTVAIEDAGWEIRDCMMWLYGSGFPKSLDISKAIDKANGFERNHAEHKRIDRAGYRIETQSTPSRPPTTDLAKQWNGWGTALKPAWEPIIVAMKPLDGTFAENAEKYGVAGLNINGGRVWANGQRLCALCVDSVSKNVKPSARAKKEFTAQNDAALILNGKVNPILGAISSMDIGCSAGLSPVERAEGQTASINCGKILVDPNPKAMSSTTSTMTDSTTASTTCDLCGLEITSGTTNGRWPSNLLLDEEAGKLLDEQTAGTRASKPSATGSGTNAGFQDKYVGGAHGASLDLSRYVDSGGASRFFYCAKASESERNAGLASLPDHETHRNGAGLGEGLTPEAPSIDKNFHPTVKPLKLMEYLCTLTKTPTGGIVLDPFAGSGTTLLAAKNTGREYVGIEQNPEYVEIIKARLGVA